MTDCRLHVCNLQFTNRQGQDIGGITQVLDPGADEIDKCFVVYPAGELPGVDIPVGDVNEDYFVNYPAGELPGVDIPVGDVSENSCAEYPTDEIQGVRVLVGCKISGVRLGYDNIRRVKMKNAAVKLIMLDSNIDFDNVGETTGVDMHAHEVARHEIVFPTDQNDGTVADLGQHRVNQVEGSKKLIAGDLTDK